VADPQALYDRTVTITRPALATTSGDAGYLGLEEANETVIASNIPASIQFDRHGTRPDARVPSDAEGRTLWKIFLPVTPALPLGSLRQTDVVTDDQGLRYQIEAPYWTALGYDIRAELLTA